MKFGLFNVNKISFKHSGWKLVQRDRKDLDIIQRGINIANKVLAKSNNRRTNNANIKT